MPTRPPIHGAAQRKERVKRQDKARAKDNSALRTAAWLYVRKQALIRDLYACQEPGCGVSVAGKGEANVDHILSRDTHPELTYVLSNLRTLCQRHHSQKTVREDGGFGNA